jgi:hypothetical protein
MSKKKFSIKKLNECLTRDLKYLDETEFHLIPPLITMVNCDIAWGPGDADEMNVTQAFVTGSLFNSFQYCYQHNKEPEDFPAMMATIFLVDTYFNKWMEDACKIEWSEEGRSIFPACNSTKDFIDFMKKHYPETVNSQNKFFDEEEK